jgi:DNA-directed RNA polymerase specialized sigma24 family protein
LLRVLIRHGVADHFRDLDRVPGLPASGKADVLDLLHKAVAPEDDQDGLHEGQVELLRNLELLAEAMKRVQVRVQPATWDVFTRTVLEGMSDREAAREFRMERNAVNQIRFRVTQRIKKVFTDLRNGAEPPPVEPQEQLS